MPHRHFPSAGRALSALLAGSCLAAVALADGKFTVPEYGQSLAAGATVDVSWRADCAGAESSEAELLLSIDGGMSFPIRISPEMEICTEGFRWQVPSLPTTRARLAVRSGAGEGSSQEALQFVSDEFTIRAAGSGATDDLVFGPAEWWTRQALTTVGAEDFLSRSLTRPAERIVAVDWSLEISEPQPRSLSSPLLSLVSRVEGSVGRLSESASRVARAIEGPLPLRL